MLKPDKYMDINLSVLSIGGVIIKTLEDNPIQKYDILKDTVLINTEDSAKSIFLNALSFLYLLGKIKYNDKFDTIELLRK